MTRKEKLVESGHGGYWIVCYRDRTSSKARRARVKGCKACKHVDGVIKCWDKDSGTKKRKDLTKVRSQNGDRAETRNPEAREFLLSYIVFS